MDWRSPRNKAVLDQIVQELNCTLSSSSDLFGLGPHATLDYLELSTPGPQQTSLWKVSKH